MSYKYLEHEADVGIEASATTVEKMFEDGAAGMFAIMVEPKTVNAKEEFNICVEGEDIAALFVNWLNEILTLKDVEDCFFSKFEVESIDEAKGKYVLMGKVFGEKIDLKKHKVHVEVKAATYFGLSYEQKGKNHIIRCVVDV